MEAITRQQDRPAPKSEGPVDLQFVDWGVMPYEQCLEKQYALHRAVSQDEATHTIILVEHDRVLTMGKNSNPSYISSPRVWLEEQGISVIRIERGGEVTAHEPGQLVVYPILNLTKLGLLPRKYVALLENVVIQTIGRFGVLGSLDPEHPGVWVNGRKICAIGVRIKDRVSLHGIALNVINDMKIFDWIVPCGIPDRGVTSLHQELGAAAAPTMEQVKKVLLKELQCSLAQLF